MIGDHDLRKGDDGDSWTMSILKCLYWFITSIASTGALFAQLNYSMDVVLGFFITNQLFAIYHTMCFPGIDFREKAQTNSLDDNSNEMENFWWWSLFEFVELND